VIALLALLLLLLVFRSLLIPLQVFLVPRVHEEWQARGDSSAAVREGLARPGA
jgi:hypothetical protein